MFNDLLNKMEEIGGFIKQSPLSEQDCAVLTENMKRLGLVIPEAYLQMLFISDGLFWGGLEFFASKMHLDKKNNANITDLISQNKLFQALNPKRKKDVFLGHSDEENYIYNHSSKKYEIISEFENEVIKAFNSFDDMFSYVVNEQIELVQNYVAFDENLARDERFEEEY